MTKIALQMRSCRPLLPDFFLILFIVGLVTPANVQADGMFVAPQFVWDKHKDINEPTQKAILVYDSGREDLILQVKYEGPVEEFGWLIPVPNLPTIQKGSMKCFYELSKYTQQNFGQQAGGIPMAASLGGDEEVGPEPVKVIEIKTVGAYEVAVLSTKDAGALGNWLEANHFSFPTNATDVIDSYVRQQWYFIAARIRLGNEDGFRLVSPKGREAPKSESPTKLKLASGELHPLQISFASDRCVFPLKISSVNGKPSEVQVYVLSPEPLLEKAMFEKKQQEVVRLNAELDVKREQCKNNLQTLHTAMMMYGFGVRTGRPIPPPETDDQMHETPEVGFWEVLPYGRVTDKELPESSKQVPRLKNHGWWLTRQTWVFQPEEMRDLEFQPAIPALAGELGDKGGYFAAANLMVLGSNAVPVLLAAVQSVDRTARANAATVLEKINDPGLTGQLRVLLKDQEPEVRLHAVYAAMNHWGSNFDDPFVGLLRDKYLEIRHSAMFGLKTHPEEASKYVPVFREMLKDKNSVVQASGLEMLLGLNVAVPRGDLLQFLKIPNRRLIEMAYSQLRNEKISCEEAVSMLQNSDVVARLIGLKILYQNADKQSVELALPLLKDPEKLVQMRAADTLQALTGQQFAEDQPDQWEKWWAENKATFNVKQPPVEFRQGGMPWTNGVSPSFEDNPPPIALPENFPR